MMNLTGKWSIAQVMRFDDEKGMVWMTAADIMAKEDHDEDDLMLLKSTVLFEEDGNLTFLSPLPEDVSQEEINEAVEAGELILRDGQMVTEQNHWKVENGKNMADTGAEGEVLGEEVGPWEEIKELDENTIELMMFRLQRVE